MICKKVDTCKYCLIIYRRTPTADQLNLFSILKQSNHSVVILLDVHIHMTAQRSNITAFQHWFQLFRNWQLRFCSCYVASAGTSTDPDPRLGCTGGADCRTSHRDPVFDEHGDPRRIRGWRWIRRLELKQCGLLILSFSLTFLWTSMHLNVVLWAKVFWQAAPDCK